MDVYHVSQSIRVARQQRRELRVCGGSRGLGKVQCQTEVGGDVPRFLEDGG